MDTVFIYALNCPLTGRTRYVGKSGNPSKRLCRHLKDTAVNHRTCWIKGLLSQGASPVLEILDEVPVAEWQFWEREWIRLYRALMFDLVNQTDGGDGNGLTGDALERMRAAKLGSKRSLETRLKISSSMTGRKLSLTHRAALSARQKGEKNHFFRKSLGLDHRLKISAGVEKQHSIEARSKRSFAMRGEKNPNFGKRMSDEQRQKISTTKLRRVKEKCP